jgi:Spy/CpxP family protein refolding chaperone
MKKTLSDQFKISVLALTLISGPLIAAQIANPVADQKASIDAMHHKLHDDQAAYKAAEAQALKELNEMTVQDVVETDELNAKIDELMAAKLQIMRLRYGHLVEMRTILTDEQKVGYDKGVLSRTAVK